MDDRLMDKRLAVIDQLPRTKDGRVRQEYKHLERMLRNFYYTDRELEIISDNIKAAELGRRQT